MFDIFVSNFTPLSRTCILQCEDAGRRGATIVRRQQPLLECVNALSLSLFYCKAKLWMRRDPVLHCIDTYLDLACECSKRPTLAHVLLHGFAIFRTIQRGAPCPISW